MKTRGERLVLALDLDRRLEARDLAPERVALDGEVDQAEPLAVEHDHAGAGAEDRRRERADRVVEPVEAHQAHHRRRLAAGDDEPVEPVELLRQAHLDRLDAEPRAASATCSRKAPWRARTPIFMRGSVERRRLAQPDAWLDARTTG